jgi:hypothetical protein
MKHFRSFLLASAVATLSLGATAAEAQYYAPPSPPPGPYHHHHRWHQGDRYYGHGHVIHHWARYNLPPPPYGYVWVQDGPTFLLLGGGGVIERVFVP